MVVAWRQRVPSDVDGGWRREVVEVGSQQVAKLFATGDTESSEHSVQVALHRSHRQVEVLGDGGVGATGDNAVGDGPLAIGEYRSDLVAAGRPLPRKPVGCLAHEGHAAGCRTVMLAT